MSRSRFAYVRRAGCFFGPWLVLALGSCVVERDIAAELQEQEFDEDSAEPTVSKDAGVRDARPADATVFSEEEILDAALVDARTTMSLECSGDANELFVLRKLGAISRLNMETLSVDAITAMPECLASGVVAAAVDAQGLLWVATAQAQLWWVAVGAAACKPAGLTAKVSTMAFVFDEEQGRELLYLLDAGMLTVIDPVTRESRVIASLSVDFLIGSADGRLLAVQTQGEFELAFGEVDRNDASFVPKWLTKRPSNAGLSSATAWTGDIALLFGTELYRLRLAETDLSVVTKVSAEFVALASSVCSARAK